MSEPAKPRVERASCSGRSSIPADYRGARKPLEHADAKAPASSAAGHSADGTLLYEWKVSADGKRQFLAKLWDGRAYRIILDQTVGAPPK
jgi:hypothetical protein